MNEIANGDEGNCVVKSYPLSGVEPDKKAWKAGKTKGKVRNEREKGCSVL